MSTILGRKLRMSVEKATFDQLRVNETPYTIIPNKVIQFHKSAEAYAVWSYLQSLPPSWKVCKDHIAKIFGYCKKKINQIFSYLNRSKLLEYRRNRNPDGTLDSIQIVVLSGVEFDQEEPYIATEESKLNSSKVKTIEHNEQNLKYNLSLNVLQFPRSGGPERDFLNTNNTEIYANYDQSTSGSKKAPVVDFDINKYKKPHHWCQKGTSGHLYILKKQYSAFSVFNILLNPVDNLEMQKNDKMQFAIAKPVTDNILINKENALKCTENFIPEKQTIDVCVQRGLDLEKTKAKFIKYFSKGNFFKNASESHVQKSFYKWVCMEKEQITKKRAITPTHSAVKFWNKNDNTDLKLNIRDFGPGNPDYDLLMQPRQIYYVRPSKRAQNKD